MKFLYHPKRYQQSGQTRWCTTTTRRWRRQYHVSNEKAQKDAQVAKLLLIANQSKEVAEKTKEQMQEMESWKSDIESKLEALTGALTGIAERLSATAKAQSALEMMVKSQGESITTALATMQTQMAQFVVARQ